MPHLSKTFQAIDRLELQGGGGRSRPTAHGMHSCVGTEYVEFGSALRIEGKVEDYMNDIVAKMRCELRALLGAALEAYNNPKPRQSAAPCARSSTTTSSLSSRVWASRSRSPGRADRSGTLTYTVSS